VQAEEPDFHERYTNNEAKYATTPAALRGFEKLQETYEAGYFNEDFGAATYNDGIRMVATGEAAHYPMLTSPSERSSRTTPTS
jgi:raffinose/stachyose/melibiose transport system substrate-binding protein